MGAAPQPRRLPGICKGSPPRGRTAFRDGNSQADIEALDTALVADARFLDIPGEVDALVQIVVPVANVLSGESGALVALDDKVLGEASLKEKIDPGVTTPEDKSEKVSAVEDDILITTDIVKFNDTADVLHSAVKSKQTGSLNVASPATDTAKDSSTTSAVIHSNIFGDLQSFQSHTDLISLSVDNLSVIRSYDKHVLNS